ncbi:peptidoglycan recognition protein family protein [Streptococcus pseudopneumoniae]|uniref:peptidoglycan recognition protein family protein n=1 Tax=Streptococcus pseudopneumoniae TaxID=257758 RepID=UPI0018B05301|nr:N-acetylmuramoyl-L-alanine amidase family protein [Streptococcus pseudopneumoniae]MBF9654752.1 N-acetylmuramoyl-L-alanine amidase family protein [Streptococcus pseudopneumoniae]
MDIDTSRLRTGLPQVGVQPYRQVHAHSTGNRNSTAQNEADYHYRKNPELGFFSHVVGNGRVMQVGPVNKGMWDVGGGWNAESYAAVELIESHSTTEEFMADYRLYIELLRNLADEAGLPKTLDTDDLAGIKTHEYCTNNQPNNNSDHVDPYPYLAKWGISREQFKRDIENGLSVEAGWKKNDTGYWYAHSDGSYPKDKFEKVNGTWYYFDVEGAMKTGWVKYKDTWYYLDGKEGAMVSNAFIQSADGTGWYYIKPDGTMADKPEFEIEPDGLITTK